MESPLENNVECRSKKFGKIKITSKKVQLPFTVCQNKENFVTPKITFNFSQECVKGNTRRITAKQLAHIKVIWLYQLS